MGQRLMPLDWDAYACLSLYRALRVGHSGELCSISRRRKFKNPDKQLGPKILLWLASSVGNSDPHSLARIARL